MRLKARAWRVPRNITMILYQAHLVCEGLIFQKWNHIKVSSLKAVISNTLFIGRYLIASPKHENGAIADRRKAGAHIVAHAKHWTILRIKSLAR